MQAMKREDPLSPNEIKEMAIRHIMSDPSNRKAAATTASLFYAYLELLPGAEMVEAAVAEQILLDWPAAIPKNISSYPAEILNEVAALLASEPSSDN